jgi:hypothetical protein
MVALCIGVSGVMWATYNKVAEVTNTVGAHERQLAKLESEMALVKSTAVSRDELGGILKRVELVLDNLLLRAGVKHDGVIIR